MALQMLLFRMLVLVMCSVNAFAGASNVISSSCPQDCGNNVSIPYPFGIGKDCYVGDWFEIVCKNRFPKPFLKRFDLEVLEINIDLRGTVRVSYPIFSNCTNVTNSKNNLELEKSPFAFSANENSFVGMGCNNSASLRMRSLLDDTLSFSGCTTPCDRGPFTNGSFCNSTNCCQITIPSNLQAFNTTMESKSSSEYCNYAFLVDQNWFENNFTESRIQTFKYIGVSASLGVLFLISGGWWSYKVIKKSMRIKRKEKFFKRNGGLLLEQQLSTYNKDNVENTKLFNSKELEKATDRFSADRIIGHGGQGTVYKGMLADGRIVAIKKSNVIDEVKLQEFINEVVILSQINHRNVVKLIGCCLETEVPLLVYEFIPNGTLAQYLNGQNEEFPPTWDMRLRIAIEAAGALFYLHSAASSPIYHRDIKSTNILLDDKYRAKVADFGISRSVVIDQTHLSTLVHGTFGYVDPEYFWSGQFTDKSDVYSFGVVLVELLTGEKAISSSRTRDIKSLAAFFVI
ncbi:putative wall-associated receptor kinase-like 11 [Juglans regia]|uniref:Wall-associated receptor kinase-like 11 n=1 Tax=Juglans regia TaxID=51240 RepID=A0A6P9EUV8_JUGRE|nr:putative wall-associated receptor kinase-like 11 [Juglans regia]